MPLCHGDVFGANTKAAPDPVLAAEAVHPRAPGLAESIVLTPPKVSLVTLNKGDLATAAQSTQTINFQPGTLTAITNTKGGFNKFVRDATVDNIELSAITFNCSVNPTVTLYECGGSPTCANPEVIGSATLTAAGQVAEGKVSNPAVGAGTYVAWAFSAGECSAFNVAASAQIRGD